MATVPASLALPQRATPRSEDFVTPLELLALAAIWGASFLFNRIAAPQIGPVLTAELRTLIAGLALAAYFVATGFNADWRRWWKQYVIVGILTSMYTAVSVSRGLATLIYGHRRKLKSIAV